MVADKNRDYLHVTRDQHLSDVGDLLLKTFTSMLADA